MSPDQSLNAPIVSVIVPTKNSAATLEACLKSIREQSYQAIELIVVDNFSTDATQEIAKKYADKVFEQGPERSPQRNFGVTQATGEYVAIIDSDMELSKEVVVSCVQKMKEDEAVLGLVIPEESFGEGFWAQCKKLERSFYVGIPWMEAARFFKKTAFEQAGGYNESMVSGEDWDLSQRIEAMGKLSRVQEFIFHNEGKISLMKTLKKKYYYAKLFSKYLNNNRQTANVGQQTSVLGRYRLFFSQPKQLFAQPLLGIGMLFMKTCEFGAGAIGLVLAKNAIKGAPDSQGSAIQEWLTKTNLHNTFLIGYYGGGNYGDELLLEVILNLFARQKVTNTSVYYSDLSRLSVYHKQFAGASMVHSQDRKALIKNILKAKSIVVGGGGLWGMDFTNQILFLSIGLWICRYILRKKIYLIGVGHYSSTPSLGRVGAWFAGHAANLIIARDQESVMNFQKYSEHVRFDKDLAFTLKDLPLTDYQQDVDALNERLSLTEGKSYVYVTLRRFRSENGYQKTIQSFIEQHSDKNIILSLCEPKDVDPAGYEFITDISRRYQNVVINDFSYNPVALYLFFKQHVNAIKVISPQFHIILVAHLAGVPFFPVAYDNKCSELIKMINKDFEIVRIKDVTTGILEDFAKK